MLSYMFSSVRDFAGERRHALGERPRQEQDEATARDRIQSLLPRDEVCNTAEWLANHSLGEPDQDAAFLTAFGYDAVDSTTWNTASRIARPQIKIFVTENARIFDHTWYLVSVTLEQDGFERFQWETARRHIHFRKLWYEHVKRDLGTLYAKKFAGAHFPSSGSTSSIMKKLVGWCIAVARSINDGTASPAVAALTLRFLDAPGPLILDKRREWQAKQEVGGQDVGGDIIGERLPMQATDTQWKEAMAAVKSSKKPRRRQKKAIDVDVFAEHSNLNYEATTDTAAIIDPFADVVLAVASEENKNPMPKRVSAQEKGESALSHLIGKRIEEHEEFSTDLEAPLTGGSATSSSHNDQDSFTRASDQDGFNDEIFQERAAAPGPRTNEGFNDEIFGERGDSVAFAPIPQPGADQFTENTRLVVG